MSTTTGLDPAIEYHIVNSLMWRGLRPLQAAAVEPVRSGDDCVLVAPTAGGKTEAALFPLLSDMVEQGWQGLSVLYVTPLRALLNNLAPRVQSYTAWLGRTAAVWHGDTTQGERRRIKAERPDVLLTTPESIEAMLVSPSVDHRAMFASVRAVVVDELHSFAASDRGWHLLGVLERVQRIAGRDIQRVGLSATIGNPAEVGAWLQGSRRGKQAPARVVVEEAPADAPAPDVQVDYVGSIANAARVIAGLHRGEKRLVFLESRRLAEQLAYELRELGTETFVSHSSLSVDERRRSERAFAESTNCVIVATSTLELGVDIGDLDRVIQVNAPRTVSSFLQRLGRTGRRPGTTRNMLFLAVNGDDLIEVLAILLLWKRGFVEAVTPPPDPRHLTAQQILALALQQGVLRAGDWRAWWGGLSLMDGAEEVMAYLRAEEFLVADGDLLLIGPRAERELGQRHFMELLSSFIAEKELRVMQGTKEIGFISPLALQRESGDKSAIKPLVLNGRGWWVEDVEWEKFIVHVTPLELRGDVRWQSGKLAFSFEVMRARRDVLLGAVPDVPLSARAQEKLPDAVAPHESEVSSDGMVLHRGTDRDRLWTWAGLRANATYIAGAELDADEIDNESIALPAGLPVERLRQGDMSTAVPWVDPRQVNALKFSVALPEETARATLAARMADRQGAREVQHEPVVHGT